MADAGVAAPEPVEANGGARRRGHEPLLVSLDEIVSEIRILGGAVEASSSVRRDDAAD
jgi:hypothetical protein